MNRMMIDNASSPAALIVYESMFGNTRRIAEAIAQGLQEQSVEVETWPVGIIDELTERMPLLIVGAPTHAHGLSRPRTRAEARRWAQDPEQHLIFDEQWRDVGIREWLSETRPRPERFAAFDTRAHLSPLFTGSAAHVIDRRLDRHRSNRIAHAESFFVDAHNQLESGEVDRARQWGRTIGTSLPA